jgi:L-rhamnose mutarotase
VSAFDDPDLETVAFVLRVRTGQEAEYLRRHDRLWPDMKAALLDAGIVHYEIWLHAPTGLLFAHQIRRRGEGPSAEAQAVMARWRAYMADVLEMDGDTPVREPLARQFRLVDQSSEKGSRYRPQ